MTPPDMSDSNVNWKDLAWALSIGAQGGFILALPVLAGLALGYWLDTRVFDTLPWLTLLLLLPGMVIGPLILYRRAVSAVKRRMGDRAVSSVDENTLDEEIA
jgi:F0F1-type ATP synthase assembly protein I